MDGIQNWPGASIESVFCCHPCSSQNVDKYRRFEGTMQLVSVHNLARIRKEVRTAMGERAWITGHGLRMRHAASCNFCILTFQFGAFWVRI